jgi:hypothetical protein
MEPKASHTLGKCLPLEYSQWPFAHNKITYMYVSYGMKLLPFLPNPCGYNSSDPPVILQHPGPGCILVEHKRPALHLLSTTRAHVSERLPSSRSNTNTAFKVPILQSEAK